jgi:hypothetical protein
MSTTTISGATVPVNFSAGGSGAAFTAFFGAGTASTFVSGGAGTPVTSTVTGAVTLGTSNSTYTLSASAVDDTTGGGNSITTLNPSTVFAAPGDTIASAAATTIFGASSGTTTFSLQGSESSVTGGAGYITGTASGANSTLVGGTGGGAFTVSGTGSLAVAGQSPGTTTITLAETTGGATVATNPLGNSGNLVATLSANGADTVVGGGGASTIAGGGGDDVFAFVNGHAGGTEIITNFTASDNFAFGGYGYSATNAPTETVTAGSDVITLTDGTVITLVGVDHKLF